MRICEGKFTLHRSLTSTSLMHTKNYWIKSIMNLKNLNISLKMV